MKSEYFKWIVEGIALNRSVAHNGGVVDDDGHAAQVVLHPLEHAPHLLHVRHVRLHRLQAALGARRCQRGRQLLHKQLVKTK